MDEPTETGGSGLRAEELADASQAPTVKLIGELDLSSVEELEAVIEPLLARAPDHFIFDMSELRFMDSTGLAVLLAVKDKVAVVELRSPSATFRKLIQLTGLTGLFEVTG